MDPYPSSLLIQLLRDRNSISLVIEQDKIIGYGIAIIRPGKKGHIISIAIDPAFRHQQYGNRLLTQLIVELKRKGIFKLQLEVRVSNIIAQKMYEKFNFKIKEIKRKYYDDGDDAYLMVYEPDM
jgi:ribosomal-protein-alanine N-acetyltransferase